MIITKQSKVGELVAEDYRTASVFQQHNIDFCCRGNRSLDDVCSDKGLDLDQLIQKLEQVATRSSTNVTDYNAWPLDLLADYIEKRHHRYVTSTISEIQFYLERIVDVHGKSHPELLQVAQLFGESAKELTAHLKKEEQVVFPFVRAMVQATQQGDRIDAREVLGDPIAVMKEEHDTEGERFRTISSLTRNYTPPDDACNTYRVTYALLKEFEEDLHLHIHLENNILFPKALAMEKELAMFHA